MEFIAHTRPCSVGERLVSHYGLPAHLADASRLAAAFAAVLVAGYVVTRE